MRKLLRRLPILLILIIGMSGLFLLVTYNREKGLLEDQYTREFRKRDGDLALLFKYSDRFAKEERWDDINALFDGAQKDGRIDFYILQFQGQPIWFGNTSGRIDEVNVKWPVSEGPLVAENVTYQSKVLAPDYQLSAGFRHVPFADFYAKNRHQQIDGLMENFIYIFSIVLLVGWFTLKDISLLVRILKRGNKGDVSQVKASSSEANLFLQGLRGYSQAVHDLEAENVRLGRQVLPSLKKEINSGRKPPYDFDCTMVRTDINNFSTIFNTHNVTEFMATINAYFDDVSVIVARYGGLIHEFVGDEVIYYFKDDEHANSFTIALSCLREVNDRAHQVHAFTMKERGYPFTVKSSVAHGKVRFGPLVSGFTIAGSVLIETVRILSQITEKEENVVYFDGVHASRLGSLITSEERLLVKMKGYQNEVALHRYVAHKPLETILANLRSQPDGSLTNYRSDEELAFILSDLQSNAEGREVEATLDAIRALREPFVTRPRLKLGPMICAWLGELEIQTKAQSGKNSERILSAAVKLYINLVPKEDFTNEDRLRLNGLLGSGDRRTIANTVEVLTHFAAADVKVKTLRDDLRITANALVHEGQEDLSPAVLKRLKALIKSKIPNEVASGLWALGELALLHRQKDHAYFSASVELQDMLQTLDVYAQHLSTMVRRQALRAARKSALEDVIKRIRSNVRDSGSELMSEEVARYMDKNSDVVHKNSAS